MIENESRTRILAIAPNWLGDVAMCTPALRALRTRFPEAILSVAGKPAACQLLDGLPWIDRLVPIPAQVGPGKMLSLCRLLHPHARDLTVVFPHSIRAALLTWLTRSRQRVGYRRMWRSPLLTHPVQPHMEGGKIVPVYMATEYLDLVAGLGCVDDGQGLELHATEADIARVHASLHDGGPVVAIAPGAAFGESKRWMPERFAAVADAMCAQRDARCILLTGPGEEDTRDAVLRAAKTPLIQCYEKKPTIARLKAAISQADLLIGNDSGPRHIAVAFGKPVVCIMGSTSPRYSEGPWEKGEVLRIDVDCGPCQRPVCTTDHRCMTGIPVERVVNAALRQLPNR